MYFLIASANGTEITIDKTFKDKEEATKAAICLRAELDEYDPYVTVYISKAIPTTTDNVDFEALAKECSGALKELNSF